MLDKKRPQLFHGWRRRCVRKLWRSKIDCILILCLSLSEMPWYLEWPDKIILGKFEEYASWCTKGWRVLGCANSASNGDALPTVFKWRQVWCFFLSIYCSTYIISLQLSRTNYATFPHKLRFSSCMLEIECAIILMLLFSSLSGILRKAKCFVGQFWSLSVSKSCVHRGRLPRENSDGTRL